MYLMSDPKRKEGDMKMMNDSGIILADLEDLIYGRENRVSDR